MPAGRRATLSVNQSANAPGGSPLCSHAARSASPSPKSRSTSGMARPALIPPVLGASDGVEPAELAGGGVTMGPAVGVRQAPERAAQGREVDVGALAQEVADVGVH